MKTLLETASEIGPVISQYIDEDENNRRVSKPVLQALIEAGFLSCSCQSRLEVLRQIRLQRQKPIIRICHLTPDVRDNQFCRSKL